MPGVRCGGRRCCTRVMRAPAPASRVYPVLLQLLPALRYLRPTKCKFSECRLSTQIVGQFRVFGAVHSPVETILNSISLLIHAEITLPAPPGSPSHLGCRNATKDPGGG